MNSPALQHNLTSAIPATTPLPFGGERTRAASPVIHLVPAVADIRGTQGWFLLSVASLILAGLFALFLVVGRIPLIAPFITDAEFFKRCLVVHVNLSLLVWFGAFAAAMFRLLPAGCPRSVSTSSFALPLAAGLGRSRHAASRKASTGTRISQIIAANFPGSCAGFAGNAADFDLSTGKAPAAPATRQKSSPPRPGRA